MLAVAQLCAAVSSLRVSPRSTRALGAAKYQSRSRVHTQVTVRSVRINASTTSSKMTWVDENDFEALREAMVLYDEQRDTVIKRARDITKASKVAIYCLHRGEIDKADAQIAQAAAVADELLPIVSANPPLRGGSYSGGLEEYAEAVVFAHFVKHGTLVPSTHPDLARCDRDEYLRGILDFTGELNRYCVAKATVRDVESVKKCREIVDALMGIFLKFDFRNGALRKKYDGLKYTLKKMENTLYEMSLTSAAAKRSREDAGLDDEPPKGGDGGKDE